MSPRRYLAISGRSLLGNGGNCIETRTLWCPRRFEGQSRGASYGLRAHRFIWSAAQSLEHHMHHHFRNGARPRRVFVFGGHRRNRFSDRRRHPSATNASRLLRALMLVTGTARNRIEYVMAYP